MKNSIITIVFAFIVSATLAQGNVLKFTSQKEPEITKLIFTCKYIDSTYMVTDTTYTIDKETRKPLRTIMSRFKTTDGKRMVLGITCLMDEKTGDFYFNSATLETDNTPDWIFNGISGAAGGYILLNGQLSTTGNTVTPKSKKK